MQAQVSFHAEIKAANLNPTNSILSLSPDHNNIVQSSYTYNITNE